MSVLTVNELKARFQSKDKPSQKDYSDMIDTILNWIATSGVAVTPGVPLLYASASLSTATYVAAYTPSVTAYNDGTVLAFKADAKNPAGGTLFNAGSGAVAIVKERDLDLAAGDIQPNQIVEVRYNGTISKWQIMSLLTRSDSKTGQIVTGALNSMADATMLLCDGSAVSRTTYASLFALVGTTFGVGDGSTTFNVPTIAGGASGYFYILT